MVWVDFVIPVIITISAGISLMRGFVREALSLLGWVVAFWVALRFSNSLAELFLSSITIPSLRIIIAFTILFVLTLILSTLINHLASHLVDKTGLTGTDRLIGMIFGMARGGVVVAMLVLLAGMTSLPKDQWWHDSVMIGHFEQLAIWLQTTVAPEIASRFPQNG
jgi:membrane protein required for colicin V production